MAVAIKSTDYQTAADLIEQHGFGGLTRLIAGAIAAERERCALVAENWHGWDAAKAIRGLEK